MAIIGAFTGGKGSGVAAGYSDVTLQWNTSNNLNLSCMFKLTSSAGTYSATSDANGSAEITVPAGTYSIVVEHTGDYTGDGPVTRTFESGKSYQIWFYGTVGTSGLNLTGIGNYATEYSLKDTGGTEVRAGVLSSSQVMLDVEPGNYILDLSLYGKTRQVTNIVVGTGGITNFDLSAEFCEVTVTGLLGSTYVDIGDSRVGTASGSPYSFTMLCESAKIEFTSNQRYSGASSSALVTYPSRTVTPTETTASVSVTPTGAIVTVSSGSSLRVPVAGRYHVMCIGGGGGGSGYERGGGGGGGGGGETADDILSLSATSYSLSFGAGGTGGDENTNGGTGGATSFSTLLSASGGSGALCFTGEGGAGGSGGGGGAYSLGGRGHKYGGGGSGSGSGSYASGGSEGGNGGTSDSKGSDGVGNGGDSFFGSGTGRGGNALGGGGGGGGKCADGGYGGSGNSVSTRGGGGGGGGVAGGDGGWGGYAYATSSEPTGGEGGKGYGAGGGGTCNTYNSRDYGGGGGGGGMGSTAVASEGDFTKGGNGAKGAIRIQWVSS